MENLHCVVLYPVSSVVTGPQVNHTVNHRRHRGVAHRLQGELHSVVQLTFSPLSGHGSYEEQKRREREGSHLLHSEQFSWENLWKKNVTLNNSFFKYK